MDFSGMNHALEKKVTCVPWELCKLTPSPRGTEDNDFVLLAAYSLGVLKHGFSFERKDASVFFFFPKSRHMALHGTVWPWHPPQRHLCVLWGCVPGTQAAQTFCPSSVRRAKPQLLPAQGHRKAVWEQRQPYCCSGSRPGCDFRPPRPLAAWLPGSVPQGWKGLDRQLRLTDKGTTCGLPGV